MDECDDIINDFFNQVRMVLGLDPFPPTQRDEIEHRLRSTWGGQPVYVRKKENDNRAALIRKEFNGRNRLELQTKYGISKGQFYKDLKGN